MSAIQEFLEWTETATVSERAGAASALARAYIQEDLSFEGRLSAEAALTLLLDDPSPRVRLALSETLSLSDRSPMQVVASLADDQPEVAAPVIMRSPLLCEGDLIDRVALGDHAIQVLVASRPNVSSGLSASIAEVGSVEACVALVCNEGAQIAALSFRRMLERFGDSAKLRGALMRHHELPMDCRHALVMHASSALSNAPLVQAALGGARAQKIAHEACTKAAMTLLDSTASGDHAALVEHLRQRGELTSSFLVRAVAHGHVEFFGAVLVALTGQSEPRIGALLWNSRKPALTALLTKAGLKRITHAPILAALQVWRDVAKGRQVAGPQEVSWHMLQEIEAEHAGETETPGRAKLARLLKQIHLDMWRENARRQAGALASGEEISVPRIAA